ncbi:MAG TPA: hypothetical protein VFV75_19200 [Candidatus Polarisedimenticolaceae bacterium]|nr:hypothetical protein [Candidatus Polarisedimenticolaceae bacterium]
MKRRTEGVLAGIAVALLSPLVFYAPRGAVPLPGMVAVASGIALSLMLAGRRLHDAMLADALGRRGRRTAVAVVLSMAAVLLIVLFAIVFSVWILLRRQADGLRPGF